VVGIWSRIKDLTLFFRSLKRCCHGNNFSVKIGEIGLFTIIRHSDIRTLQIGNLLSHTYYVLKIWWKSVQ